MTVGWNWTNSTSRTGSPARRASATPSPVTAGGFDVEFVQFHPTVMWTGPDAVGQQALVSEAVRGEGAILYDGAGQRVMLGVHPQEDLAPRDVVAAAISRRMAEAPGGIDDHVFLDATHMGERFYTRFPSITEACRAIGIDPAHDRIPVAPATTLSVRLFEASRLAPWTRLGRDLAWEVLDRVEPDEDSAPGAVVDPLLRPEMRAAMSRHVGVVRDVASLATAAGVLDAVAGKIDAATPSSRVAWEATNLLTVGSAVVAAAAAREESRGCHRRSDFPEPRAEWLRHLDVRLGADGELVVEDA